MQFDLLGTLEARVDEVTLPLGQPKQRALLALLLTHPNRVLSRERLVDDLWGARPPATAPKAIAVYVSRLRKLLPADVLVTQPQGYVLSVDPESIDACRFERLLAEAHAAAPERAAGLLREALALWRGPALAEFPEEPFARLEASRLEDLRLGALEERIEADLALGGHREVVAELEALLAAEPHRDRLRAQLMLALYRSGRQVDALEAYRNARAALDELGLEPSAELRQLERRILEHDPGLDQVQASRHLVERVALPGPLVPGSPFPFVGRERELAALRERLSRAAAGEGAFVLVAGEAGAGKTRLVRELAQEAAAAGVLVLYGASNAAVATPYRPLREWLEFLVRVADRRALLECVGGGEALERLAPELARFAGEPPPPPQDDAEAERFLLQSAALQLLRRLAAIQPLLVVAEDIHWADIETLQLLGRLARAVPEGRLLAVATVRDPGEEVRRELGDALSDISRLEGVTRLRLGGLSREEVSAFVRASADGEASAELLTAFSDLTGGTPLLVCELWRELREGGALELSENGVRLTRPPAELPSPQEVRDLVGHRLARLRPESASLVELAAVAGPQFELRVLAAAAGLVTAALVDAVESAVRAGILEELAKSPTVGRFTHELVRRAIYDRIARIRRAELHLRVGEALERVHPDPAASVLPELAYHFTLAAPVSGSDRGIDYSLRAAEAAIGTGAYDLAAARLTSALELGIDDPRERSRRQAELSYLLLETGRVAEMRAVAADSLRAASGREESGIAAHALMADAQEVLFSDPELEPKRLELPARRVLETLEELHDVPGVVRAKWLLAQIAWRQGRAAAARSELERVLPQAESGGEAVLRRVVTSLAGVLCDGPAPVGEATLRCEELLRSYGRDRVCEGTVTRCLSLLLAMAGRFGDAQDHVQRSGLVLDVLPMTTPSSVYRSLAARALELAGDGAGAGAELSEKWRSLRDASGTRPDARAMDAACMHALLLCDDGRWDEAERRLSYGDEVPEPGFFRVESVLRLAARARVAANHGELDEALALARRAVDRAEPTDLLDLRARLWLALAEVQRATGAEGGADVSAATALELHRKKGNVAAAANMGSRA